ncbi:putative neural-cadherin 2 [Penaeus chinensis]|uniref:putative neural-cadherin 2 n=1 Tax=Penaeus chinensis TaxID=139456 RepID=UPI001FB6B22C|nr:putative neural-cadherin 2 [Penaeus chinensis]
MDPGKIFQIITNSTLLATRLISGPGVGSLGFTEPRYCAVLAEDAPLAAVVTTVTAIHKYGEEVRYSITGGNRDGLFTIDQHSGTITLAAPLDYELHDRHELVIAGEAAGQEGHAIVQVRVADVNDNAPLFVTPDPQVTVIEEDDRHLPATILKVGARDRDKLDIQGLLYTVEGDGVDGLHPTRTFFSINSQTGDLVLLRPLDRDPPRGKGVWRLKVQVRDGQSLWRRQAVRAHSPPSPPRYPRAHDGVKRDDPEPIPATGGQKGHPAGATNSSSPSTVGGGCEDLSTFGGTQKEGGVDGVSRGGRRVHLVETQVTVLVKDINDNPPVFPNATMFGEVQENGPIATAKAILDVLSEDLSVISSVFLFFTKHTSTKISPLGDNRVRQEQRFRIWRLITSLTSSLTNIKILAVQALMGQINT